MYADQRVLFLFNFLMMIFCTNHDGWIRAHRRISSPPLTKMFMKSEYVGMVDTHTHIHTHMDMYKYETSWPIYCMCTIVHMSPGYTPDRTCEV